ncbi:MAG: glycine cleavage system protein GcvH [Burkholderiales bacterium]
MANVIEDYRYTAARQWSAIEPSDIAAVGITDFAQKVLSDMVFVEFPKIGQAVTKDGACAVVESVKSASDVYAPLSGSVTKVNANIQNSPELINHTPYETWLFKIKISQPTELNTLLTASTYQALTDQEAS